jgi:protocatechuate 3,4-dioxygenase beta subunit
METKMKGLSRRKYLKNSLVAASSLLVASKAVKAGLESCGLTPEQTEGPFYPIKDQKDKDNDLTKVKGRKNQALGEVIIIKGKVLDEDCRPVANALVEIWQACATGRYNHPGDPNTAKLDPDFQYWGRAITNEKGEYSFKTIKPGHYQATSTWMRPAHIHLKVHRRGFEELTSQVYFEGDKYNSGDRVLQGLPKEEREKVIISLKKQIDNFGLPKNSPKVGEFDITIRSI